MALALNDLQRVADKYDGPHAPNGWELHAFLAEDPTQLEVCACRDDGEGTLDALVLDVLPRGSFSVWGVGNVFLLHLEHQELRVYDTTQWRAWQLDTFQPTSVCRWNARVMVRWHPDRLEAMSFEEALARFGLAPDLPGALMASSAFQVGETFYDPFALASFSVRGTQGRECGVQPVNGRAHLVVPNLGLFRL